MAHQTNIRWSLVAGLLSVNIVLSMDPTTKDLVTPLRQYGEACGYESCVNPKEGVLNVHLVPHTHGELGTTRTFYQHYTGRDEFYDNSLANMKRILDFVISELWAHQERTFAFSDLPYFFYWWMNRDETVRRMVYQLIRQGRLSLVGGGWGMPDEATTSYHALIDQFTFALRKLNATFLECARPLVSWQSDSFGHSREFASLMAQMGFDGHFISPISYDDELGRMRDKKLEMLWRGSDDLGAETDIFTHKLFDGYWTPPGFCFGSFCKDPLLVTSDSQFKNVDERVDAFLESMFQRQSPQYSTQHVMVMMGKRFGYFDAPIWFYNIDTLINAVNSKGQGKIYLFYSTPACYLKAVHDANPVLPLKQSDFLPLAYDRSSYFSGMFTSCPSVKLLAREGHVYLQIAKQLQVLARLPANDKVFEELNWITGAFQDHNIITGGMRPHVKKYYTHKMYIAVQRSTLLLRQAFNKMRKSAKGTTYYRCDFNISSCRITNSHKFTIVIYNPLSWPVSLPVRLPVGNVSNYKYTIIKPNQQIVKPYLVKLPKAVMRLPNRSAEFDHELVFISEDIPALGYRSYFVERFNKAPIVKITNSSKDAPRNLRSIIKKINRNKNKKYLIRQANNIKIDDESLLNNVDPNADFEEYDDYSVKSKIEFGNVTASAEYKDNSDILTPKPKPKVEPTTEEQPTTSTTTEEEQEATTTTEKIVTTTDVYDVIDKNDHCVSSNDHFISNKYVNISLDSSKQIQSVTLSNGVKIALKIQLFYYASDDPVKMRKENERPPGVYIFKTMDPRPVFIKDSVDAEVVKTDIVEELHTAFSNYASYAVKLYADKPFIEIDWIVGPIPVTDEIGKDVFIRYNTDLMNDGVFYTDSNGRQTMKRIRDKRADFVPVDSFSIPSNIYPVTSKIYIEDTVTSIRFSVFNDRAQGGTSLQDGQVDLMLHRRILTADTDSQTYLNETEHGEGVVIRGKHYLYIAKANYKPHKIFEKKFAKEIELAPQILVSRDTYYNQSREIFLLSKNEISCLNKKLPIGVHLLTLQEWNDGTLLIRLENYLEKADTVKDGIKIVFLKDLFVNINVREIKETTLDGVKWLEDWVPLPWRRAEDFYENANEAFEGNSSRVPDEDLKPFQKVNMESGIRLMPQQIRTFVAWFDYVGI